MSKLNAKWLNFDTQSLENSSGNLQLNIDATANTIVKSGTGVAVNTSTVALLAGDQTFTGNNTFSNTISGSIDGNSATVTNGVYTNGTYNDPAWLTGLAGSKVTGVVHDTGNESVGGIKTFTSIPVLPASDPTTDNQAVRKSYVDGLITGLAWKDPVYVAAQLLSGTGTDGGILPACYLEINDYSSIQF